MNAPATITVTIDLVDDEPHRPTLECAVGDCSFQTSRAVRLGFPDGTEILVALCCAHREIYRAQAGWRFPA